MLNIAQEKARGRVEQEIRLAIEAYAARRLALQTDFSASATAIARNADNIAAVVLDRILVYHRITARARGQRTVAE